MNFYPRSPCGERRKTEVPGAREKYFYPRSPCGERPNLRQNQHQRKKISIHALLAESDNFRGIRKRTTSNFYPRSPCGERQHAYQLVLWVLRISIHALLAESDLSSSIFALLMVLFLSTLSLRRATFTSVVSSTGTTGISIHALLAESDTRIFLHRATNYISIHALLAESDITSILLKFGKQISIHALLAESDQNHEATF